MKSSWYTLMGVFYILISGLCSALAGASLKLGAEKKLSVGGFLYTPHAVAVVFYFVGFVFYFLALSKLSLSTAYPIMVSSAIIFVMLLGCFLFSESISTHKIIGVVLIISGVCLVNFKG
ncbi:SMR family transporter [Enterobacter asburiae]